MRDPEFGVVVVEALLHKGGSSSWSPIPLINLITEPTDVVTQGMVKDTRKHMFAEHIYDPLFVENFGFVEMP